MLSNRLAFLALAVACIGAAAGGGYLATRQNTIPAPAAAQAQPLQPAAPAANSAPAAKPDSATPATPVQETEGIVGDRAPRTPAPAPTAKAAPKQAENAKTSAPRDRRPAAPIVARQDPAPSLTASWPAGSAPQPPPPAAESAPAAPRPDERAAQDPPRAPEPPVHTFTELVVAADSVLGLQTETRVSTETARVEDRIDARVTRDVRVGDRVAIPAGSRALGSVMLVERGGKLKERARLGIRFHTLVLADGTRIPIATETIYREGEAPGNSSQSKIGGGAVGGAILGAILGGGKGMAIGAAAGAGAGAAAVAASDRNAAMLPAGSPLTVRIVQPITIATDSKDE